MAGHTLLEEDAGAGSPVDEEAKDDDDSETGEVVGAPDVTAVVELVGAEADGEDGDGGAVDV